MESHTMALTEERYQEIRRIVVERRRQRDEDQRRREEGLEKMIAEIQAQFDAVTDEELEDFLLKVDEQPDDPSPRRRGKRR